MEALQMKNYNVEGGDYCADHNFMHAAQNYIEHVKSACNTFLHSTPLMMHTCHTYMYKKMGTCDQTHSDESSNIQQSAKRYQ